jgi:hypothetical protein
VRDSSNFEVVGEMKRLLGLLIPCKTGSEPLEGTELNARSSRTKLSLLSRREKEEEREARTRAGARNARPHLAAD